MNSRNVLLAFAALTLGACSKTKNGDIVVDKPVGIQTTQDTLHPPTVGTRTDTINTPVVGTKTDTLIVKKPVVGSKKSVVTVPTVKKP
jgi:hypothetical protein